MTNAAADYIREVSDSMSERYVADCVTHACRAAELLLAEGRGPWIGRLREVIVGADGVFHAPLTPKRFLGKSGPTWTTHYVACSGNDVYDPLVGTPIGAAEYSTVVFGRSLTITTELDTERIAQLLHSGELRRHFRPAKGV